MIVVGSSRSGEAHQILLDDTGHWQCSCPGGQWRPEHPCKHRVALAALRAGGKL